MPGMADLTVVEAARALRDGSITAAALAEDAIARQEKFGKTIGSYMRFLPDEARRAAKAADAAFAIGADLGPLQGIPVSVKDLYGMEGLPIYAGSPKELPEKFRAEGPVVRCLRQQLAVIVGRTHTSEFAYGEYGYGTNSQHHTPRNPWDPVNVRPPGGSSSGAATSLCEGTALVGIGSDTTGSVREPASLTGNVGLKITHGRWSLEGIVPCSPSLDTPGPLARTVTDAALAFAALDPLCDAKRLARAVERSDLAGLKIGVAEDYYWSEATPSVVEGAKRALDELARAGARLVPMKLPEARKAQTVFDDGDPCTVELYAFLSSELPEWIDLLRPSLKVKVLAGGKMSAPDYFRRWRLAESQAKAFEARWAEVDVFAMPTISITPPTIDELRKKSDPNESRNTSMVNLLRLCAVSMPVGLDAAGMPIGLQLAAPTMGEERLLAIAAACERALGTSRQRLGVPPMCR